MENGRTLYRRIAVAYIELPLIGMMFSPVDFVAGMRWQTYDSTKWPHDGDIAFIPQYRKNLAQHVTKRGSTSVGAPPWIEMAYCYTQPQTPPLEKLLFRATFHNRSDESRWILLPSTLYSAPTQHRPGTGVNGMELLADDDDRIKLVKFLGTQSADATDAKQGGGFQAVLLAPKAIVAADVVVDYWGHLARPLAITAVIARGVSLDGKSIDQYFEGPLQTNSSSTSGHLKKVQTWSTSDNGEVPVRIISVDRYTVSDALAIPCAEHRP
jgi:hypothetical protein